jgi:PKHD-type hydroxylase
MILTINAIHKSEDLEAIHARLAKLEWRDGRETAGKTAREVKQNEQAVLTSETGEAVYAQLLKIVSELPVLTAAARPRRFSHLIVSRTRDGGHYGAHVDNALMGRGDRRMRTDISFTLFLSDPGDYEGGELVIHSAGMTQTAKPKAGVLVLYPSSSIHEVKPVTSGTRIACVGWIESWIQDGTQRELLFDLENLRATMRNKHGRQSSELLTLDKTIANLLRMWGRL